MKFKTNKFSLNPVFTSSLLAASVPAFIATRDIDQPIHIESDQQSLGMQGNVITFTGNVTITQGTIRINADKVVITCPGGRQGKEVIDGCGRPVTPYQIQGSSEPVEGHAPWMHYELAKDFVVLTGNAYLQRVDSSIKSDKTTYLVKKQKMQVFSDRGKHVTTVLASSQLQDRNNKDWTPTQKKGN